MGVEQLRPDVLCTEMGKVSPDYSKKVEIQKRYCYAEGEKIEISTGA